MKIKLNTSLFLCLLMVFVTSCSKNNDTTKPVLSDLKAITSFTVAGENGAINESAKTIFAEVPKGTNITSLAPEIVISQNSTIAPASGASQDFSNPVIYTVTAEDGSSVNYTATVSAVTCGDPADIYSFTYNGKNYEIIKKNKTWAEAAACAAERGGYLAEINNGAEDEAIFTEIITNATITNSNTVAFDGGEASYVWIGGNDISTEGTWIWDGNNDGASVQFWQGDNSGNAIDGRYNNWGNEPDNYTNQDGLGLALTEWPLGSGSLGTAGQWNDIKTTNKLYYVVEYD